MPESPLLTAGAQIEPSAAAPLHTNEFFTGMWTQGNPLGPGAVPYLYQKFYSAARYDRLVGGQNLEVTSKLTLARRPGHSVYNAGPFPPINRFYEFRAFQNSAEIIHLMASCDPPPNLLANGQFQNGAGGWTLGAGWVVGLSGLPHGSGIGLSAAYTGPGTAVITNLTHVPCEAAGTVLTVSCWSTGEIGATGVAVLQVTFYTAGGVAIGPTYSSAPAIANYTWALLSFTEVTPAGAAYAIVDYAVTGSTGGGGGARWYAVEFSAVYNPGPATVRDVTAGTNLNIWNKNAAAGRTGFQNVGNILYFADGVDAKKWIQSGKTWTVGTVYQNGDFIVDSNNNLQMAMGAQTATITNIQVEAYTLPGPVSGKKVTLFLAAGTPLDVLNNISLTLAGLTTVPTLNGATPYTAVIESSTIVVLIGLFFGVPVTAYSVETGTATTGNGTTGAAQPVWNPTVGLATQDNGLQWINLGSSVQNWGFPGPATAPTVTQVAAPSIYPVWTANTWYAPTFIIFAGGVLYRLTTAGITGGAAPAFNPTLGATTADNTCIWTSLGPSVWAANTVYAAGTTITATYTYYITVQQIVYGWTGTGFGFHTINVTTPVTATSAFNCVTGGTSGANQPGWTNGLGTTLNDNGVIWTNTGTPHAWPGAAQTLSLAAKVIDSNGNIQVPQTFAESGATNPAWATASGAATPDNNQFWLNQGPYSAASTAAWQWAYSGKNSITGHISTASPISPPMVVSSGHLAVIQGVGPTDPQEDTIVLWRTVQGGSLLMYDDEFPNPGPGLSWIYTDTTQDPSSVTSPLAGQLNFLIIAPINSSNDPPPAGFVPQAYYLGRIWGYVGNRLAWSDGPAAITGSGNEGFAPLNQTTFPSLGVTCWATSIGLICYTNSDVWVVLGQGTANSPFYVINFQQGVGLANQDAFAVNGSTAYGILTSGQVVSMDPGAGELEVGFPIGDQFDAIYTPGSAYCAWHQGSSADMALYVADGAAGWFRMAAVAAPESGNVWSPRALIAGGVKAIASLEIQPGMRRLLLGPATTGPILIRDKTTSADNGTPFAGFADIGSIQMAQPGTTVGVQYLVTEELAIAGSSAAYVAVLFDEISSGGYSTLRNRSNDPPNLPSSESVTVGRWWTSQDAGTVPICRHMRVRIGWPAEAFANELLTYTIYGRLPQKARK